MRKMNLKFEIFIHTKTALCRLDEILPRKLPSCKDPPNTTEVKKAVEILAERTVPYELVKYALNRLVKLGYVKPEQIPHGDAKPENKWRLIDPDAFKTKHMKFSETIQIQLKTCYGL